ncbi:DEAD/DEAH box helicase [Streptomyces albulus]|nr:DEAD/DEAH box helicase [Streptomyces noursei]
MARSAPPDRPPRGAYATCAQQEGHRSRQECLSDGSGPAPSGPAGRRCTNPYDGAVRPPPPPPAASHRRGKTLSTTFRDLGIFPETAEALEAVGIVSPFPIQELTLPVALSGNDVIGQAKTGTGKTLGFGLPLLERVTVPADVEAGRATPEQLTEAPQALVVVPTRELCQQVTNDLLTAGKVRNVRVLAIYGGRAYEPQVEALKKGVDVVVGTPGRLLDLAGQKKLNLSQVRTLVLDEADEMLDLGFLPDVEKILQLLPAKRQTMLFSATMPGQVISLARRYMSQPTHIRATAPDDQGATVANITQHVYRAHSLDKPEMVARMLQAEGRGLAMVFCRTKRTAADIADQLARRGFASGAVHGDLGQGAREQALRAFRNGKVDVLVCTDVAARGIDVEGVTHVINYQSPEDEKTYLHRIGRTGRAGAKGTAVTLVDWDDIPRWKLINKALELSFDEPEETYSTSPHLYEQLNIPAGTKGVLPRAERTRAGLAAEEVEDLGETGAAGAAGGPAVGPRGDPGRAPAHPDAAPAAPDARWGPSGGAGRRGRVGDRQRRRRRGAHRRGHRGRRGPAHARRRRRTRGAVATANEAAVAEHREATAGAVAEAATVPAPRPARTPRRARSRPPAAPAPHPQRRQDRRGRAGGRTGRDRDGRRAGGRGRGRPGDGRGRGRRPGEPKRTRKRAAAKKTSDADAAPVAVDAVDGGATTPVVADVEAPAKPKRTRTRKAAAAEPAVEAEAAVATAEGVDAALAKPKRTRKTAATKAAAAKKTAAEPAEATDGRRRPSPSGRGRPPPRRPPRPPRGRGRGGRRGGQAQAHPQAGRPKKTADAAAVEG